MVKEILAELRSVFSRPSGWLYAAAVFVVGSLIGVGFFTFGYANGASYLSNDPKACVNCHVMRDQYDGWMKSSHGKVAVCNDCHAPHDIVGKYATKAINGWNHGFAFTTGNFPQNIQITQRNREITEQACLSCHADITSGIRASRPEHSPQVSCISCHRNVGHM
ncbi:cytochrome c nitrite reductase small subunit [Austwickia chelonae]|uniref:Cytochrome c-type protein n=1 Tax=Austwickia chelonae NBRC 105200 TaxID=1184607 RepID=K6VTZ3_9MICO|nr:cytochrome c nitrite reductase small subunit [Austwickia chelonae]GAB78815.1 cytochrome c-type protein NrfH [Austwickia chelonae NBRC 105200]SEV84724.1 cytochrome c nitrite reductase small subunit [Austwickia chelonae]